jgi:hypothetical protein
MLTEKRRGACGYPVAGQPSISAGLFALCLFGTVASVNVGNDLAWWQDSANRSSGPFSAFVAVGAAVLFGILLTHLTHGTTSAWLATARTLASRSS